VKDFDVNRLLTLGTVVIIILIAAGSGYRVEISSAGIKFEQNAALPIQPQDMKISRK